MNWGNRLLIEKLGTTEQRGKQGKKKVSNDEWRSASDPESRIVKMKDGRTHLGYKAEHVIDLETEFILSAHVYHGTCADTATLLPSVGEARRSWLRGLDKITKRYSIQTAARNLGLLMLKLFGIGKPRGLQGEAAAMGAVGDDRFRLGALSIFRWPAIRRLSALAGPRQRWTALAA